MIYNDHIFGAAGPKGSPDVDLELDTQMAQNTFTDALNAMLQKDRIPTDTNTNTNPDNDNDNDDNDDHDDDNDDHDDHDDNDDHDVPCAPETPAIHAALSTTSSTTESALVSALERAFPPPVTLASPPTGHETQGQTEDSAPPQSEHEPTRSRGRGGSRGGGRGRGRGRGRGTTPSIVEGGNTTVPAIRRNTRSGGI